MPRSDWSIFNLTVSIILSWAFSTISKVRLFWLFTMTMFVASVGLVYLKLSFVANNLVQTDIWAFMSYNA